MEYNKGRILEYLNEVNQTEWVEREINTIYDKAEAFDRIKKMVDQLDQYIKSDADDYQKGYLIGKKLGELYELVNE